MARSSVDLPVPGGPSITTCRPVSSATVNTSRSRRSPMIGGAGLTCSSVLSPTPSGTPSGRCQDRHGRAVRESNRSVVDNHAPHVLAVDQVLVALVDLVERVGTGDQLVQLELAG